MNWIIIMFLLVFILSLIFIPFPIFLNIKYEQNKLYIYIYKFKIYPLKNNKKKQKKRKHKSPYPKSLYFDVLETVYRKSPFTFSLDMTYGFDDAAITAMSYGILNIILSGIYQLFYYNSKLKNFKVNINPIFNKNFCELEMKSIIFISLGKIIYIRLKFKEAC